MWISDRPVNNYLRINGSKTQVTFHRSLIAGHCFTFLKVTQNPQFGLLLHVEDAHDITKALGVFRDLEF